MRKICTVFMAGIIVFCCSPVFAKNPADEAWASYMSGDYNRAITICKSASGSSMALDRSCYLMGLSYLKLGKADTARDKFKTVLENCPTSDIRDSALLGLSDSYYVEGDFRLAECYYQGLIDDFPYSSTIASAYLRLGNAQLKLGKSKQAQKSFDNILKFFPLSPEYEDARKHLSKKIEYFSVQLGAFSKRVNADALLSTVRAKGYNVFMEEGNDKGESIYRVKVGKFLSKEDAEAEAGKLKNSGYSVRIVT
ncbi:MAG: SPOR domain-containing protein [Candidatus Omnitrophota bacterium]